MSLVLLLGRHTVGMEFTVRRGDMLVISVILFQLERHFAMGEWREARDVMSVVVEPGGPGCQWMDELPCPHKQMWREASWVHLVIHCLTQQRLTEWGLATSQETRGSSSMREEALETWAGTERLHSQLLCYLY